MIQQNEMKAHTAHRRMSKGLSSILPTEVPTHAMETVAQMPGISIKMPARNISAVISPERDARGGRGSGASGLWLIAHFFRRAKQMRQMPAAEIANEAIQSRLKPPAPLNTISIVRGTK